MSLVTVPLIRGIMYVVKCRVDNKATYGTNLRIVLGSLCTGCMRNKLIHSSATVYGTNVSVASAYLIVKAGRIFVVSSFLGGIEVFVAYTVTTCALVPIFIEVLTVFSLLLQMFVINYFLNIVVSESLAVFEGDVAKCATFTAVVVYRLVKTVSAALSVVACSNLLIEYANVRNGYCTNEDSDGLAVVITVGNGNGCCGSCLIAVGTAYTYKTLLVDCDPGRTVYTTNLLYIFDILQK